MSQQVIAMLDQLAEIQSQLDVLQVERNRLTDALIPAEIKAEIAAINAEFADKIEMAESNARELRSQLVPLVLEAGASVKGERLQAIVVKGRVSWDTKALDGYAINHPELFAFRKEGEPTVQIRTRK